MPKGKDTSKHPNRAVNRHRFVESPAEYLERVSGDWSAPDPNSAVFRQSVGPKNTSTVEKVTDEGNIISSSLVTTHIYDKNKNKTSSYIRPKGVDAVNHAEMVMKSGMLDYPLE